MKKLLILISLILLLVPFVFASTSVTSHRVVSCDGGVCSGTMFGKQVAYHDGYGFLLTDGSITSSDSLLYDYEVVTAPFRVYFNEDATVAETVRVEYNQSWMTGRNAHKVGFVVMQPQSLNWRNSLEQIDQVSTPASTTASPSGDVMSYDDVYGPGLSLEYVVLSDRVKEYLVIDSYASLPVPSSYITDQPGVTLDLDTLFDWNSAEVDVYVDDVSWDRSGTIDTNSSLLFKRFGELLWEFPAPLAVDSLGNEIVGTYRLKRQATKLYIEAKIPFSWLQNATYPVRIDPSVELTVGSGDLIADVGVRLTDPDDNLGTSSGCRTGSGSASWRSRCYVAFNVSWLSDDAVISSAAYHFYYSGGTSGLRDWRVYGVNFPWISVVDESTLTESTLTWNNQPCGGTGGADYDIDNSTNCNTTPSFAGQVRGYFLAYTTADITTIFSNRVPLSDVISIVSVANSTGNTEFQIRSKEYEFDSLVHEVEVNYMLTATMNLPAKDTTYYSENVTVNVTSSGSYDNETWYSIDGGANNSLGEGGLDFQGTMENLTEGSYEVQGFANETGGDITETDIHSFNVDLAAPSLESVSLSPATAYTNDTIGCDAVLNDTVASSITAYYTLYLNDAVNSSGSTACASEVSCKVTEVAVADTSKGQAWKCEVQPEDGGYNGTATNSSALTISNLVPVVSSVTLSPSSPLDNGTLSFTNTTSDADTDAITAWSIKWFLNDVQNTSYDNVSSLSATNLSGTQNWTVSLAAYDGEAWGAYTNSSDAYVKFSLNVCHVNITIGGTSTIDANVAATSAQNITRHAYCDGGTPQLVRVGVDEASNPISSTLGVGVYEMVGNSSGDENYSTNTSGRRINITVTAPVVGGGSAPGGGGGGSTVEEIVFNTTLTVIPDRINSFSFFANRSRIATYEFSSNRNLASCDVLPANDKILPNASCLINGSDFTLTFPLGSAADGFGEVFEGELKIIAETAEAVTVPVRVTAFSFVLTAEDGSPLMGKIIVFLAIAAAIVLFAIGGLGGTKKRLFRVRRVRLKKK